MGILERTGWVLVGAVVGALATGSVGAVKQQAHAPDPSRLTVALASTSVGMAAFVKDTRSDGCWIVFIRGDDGASIAPAPGPACSDSQR